MRILNNNCVYDFNAVQEDAVLSDATVDELTINLRYRKYEPFARTPEIEERRCVKLSCENCTTIAPHMANMLQEFDVPTEASQDMGAHLQYYVREKIRRRRGTCVTTEQRVGGVIIAVSLDVRVISPERAAAIQARMEAGRRDDQAGTRVRRVVEEVAERQPAKKGAVDALERVCVDDHEERECAICLEGFGVGVEVVKMPCSHIYHTDCIIRWLDRSCFCPFCRFKLPS